MAKIQIYARVRPTKRPYDGLQVLDTDDADNNRHHIRVSTGDTSESNSYSKSPATKHDFSFKHVFNESSTQAEVFDVVAKDMIDSFLKGFNGTIFAYGQTSSGKTHTIEGSGRRFADRGLIPRTLSYIYKAIEKRSEEEMSVNISYMEIYQDTGYDLLNPGMRPGSLMVEIPKVQIAEGPRGEVIVRNLSSHLAATEEVAQSLLFQGSTCRKVAETSMNQCSSRSHTIFSITLTAKSPGCEVITKSKLNLVDLAGSERVAKTGADGRVLQEAKHINLSLHHLEHVIVTLQQQLRHSSSNLTVTPSSSKSNTRLSADKSSRGSTRQSATNQRGYSRGGLSSSSTSSSQLGVRKSESGSRMTSGAPRTPRTPSRGMHVPYRNCMLTMVLKDSLGGNCLTAMIATISAEESNLHETISTCRFSQRVACISNRARRNEELDDKVVIKRLKQRILELENEVEMLKQTGLQPSDSDVSTEHHLMTDSDRKLCHQVLHDFFHGNINNPVTAGIDTPVKFNECLVVLKSIVLHALGITATTSTQSPTGKMKSTNPVSELSNQVKERMNLTSSNENRNSHSSTSNSTLQTSPKETQEVPSPNSRLSSGFGSLHDEEYCNDSYDFSHRKIKQESPLSHSSVDCTKSRQKSKESHKTKTSSTKSSTSSKNAHKNTNTTVRKSSSDHSNPISSSIDNTTPVSHSKHKRKIIEDAWSSPHVTSPPQTTSTLFTSPPSSSDKDQFAQQTVTVSEKIQILKVHSPRESSNVVSPRFSIDELQPPRKSVQKDKKDERYSPQKKEKIGNDKPLSPREEKAVQKLVEKQIALQRSHEQKKSLLYDIRGLDLKVQEEKLRDELQQVGEQLASQHVRVTRLQQGQVDPEKLCAEKIAEQQLRIKQAKIHQKLLDTHYQYKTLQNVNHTQSSNPLSPPMINSGSNEPVGMSITASASPPCLLYSPPNSMWTTSTQMMRSELVKHELKQSKVQQQIEKLRVSQMEKQLELKEASTRRKILALKQQLQGNTETRKLEQTSSAGRELTSTTKTNIVSASSPSPIKAATHTHSTTFSSPSSYQRQSCSNPLSEPKKSTIQNPLQHTLTSPPFSTPLNASSIPLSVHGSEPLASQKEHVYTAANVQRNSSTNHQVRNDNHHTRSQSQPIKAANSISSCATIKPKITAAQVNHEPSSWENSTIKLSTEKQQSKSQSRETDKPIPQTQSPPPPPSTPKREKLTLPEEIKETEYMTALQRQKARVSRIRRCIVAATVIQRAWRDYKSIAN